MGTNLAVHPSPELVRHLPQNSVAKEPKNGLQCRCTTVRVESREFGQTPPGFSNRLSTGFVRGPLVHVTLLSWFTPTPPQSSKCPQTKRPSRFERKGWRGGRLLYYPDHRRCPKRGTQEHVPLSRTAAAANSSWTRANSRQRAAPQPPCLQRRSHQDPHRTRL